MKKRILTMLLAVLLCAGLLPLGAAAADLKFVDVSPEAWYYNDVKTAVDSGLVNGKTETTYCPDDNLTYAEAVKLAACMHQKYTTGVVSLVNGDPWYMSYVDYAKMNAIISKDYDWNSKATRAGYMAIFAHALPDTALTAANSVTDGSIPDVPMSHPQAAEIYKLYRAGILQGSADTYKGAWTEHLSKPDDSIKRSEVAAILTRMMFVDKRISFSMGEKKSDAPVITLHPKSVTVDAGQAATFTVKAEGKDLTYQWYYLAPDTAKWKEVSSNGKTDTLILAADKSLDGYSFLCTVTNGAGTVNSTAAVLTVNSGEKLAIVKQPENYTLKTAAEMALFSVQIKGGKAPYTYKWVTERESVPDYYVNDQSDALTSVFYFETDKNSFTYTKYIRVYCVITDANGDKVTTNKVEIVQPAGDLKITKQPVDYLVKSTDTEAKFTVEISGGKAPYNYYWVVEGSVNIKQSESNSSSTTSILTVDNPVGWVDNNSYVYVYCVITDSANTKITTEVVRLTKSSSSQGLKITKQPTSVTCKLGETAIFMVEATGGRTPYKYQWCYTGDSGGVRIFNPEIASSSIFVLEVDDAIYYNLSIFCEITDADGNKVDSDYVKVKKSGSDTPSNPLKAYVDQTSVNLSSFDDTFSLQASATGGTGNYTYQWWWGSSKDGLQDMSTWDSTSSSAYQYSRPDYRYHVQYMRCRVTDSSGNWADTPVVTISVSSSSQGFEAEAVLTSSEIVVNVSGGRAPYTYQWKFRSIGTGSWKDVTNGDSASLGSAWTVYDYSEFEFRCLVRDANGFSVYSNSIIPPKP